MFARKTKAHRYSRLALSQLVLSALILGTCRASEMATEALPHEGAKIALSGEVAGGLSHNDVDGRGYAWAGVRLQLQVQPAENLELATRLHAWTTDSSEPPNTNDSQIDRCFVSWNEVGGQPLRLTGGRLPTMGETSPGYLRLGLDQSEGWLSSFADIAMDGAALAYRHQTPLPGQLRFYYATQIDAGYSHENITGPPLEKTTIYGLQWDLALSKSRSLQFQSLLLADLWNVPEGMTVANPLEYVVMGPNGEVLAGSDNGILDRQKLGNIYQTSLTYLDKVRDLNIFATLGWSHTDPDGCDELGTGLLSSWWEELKNEDGFAFYAGLRYDIEKLHSSIGLEYNYGSKYWVSFAQHGSENSKLATRGAVTEVYWTVKPPIPVAMAKTARALIGRLSYQHYDFNFTGSGLWLGEPLDIDSLQADPLSAQFYTPVESMDQVNATLTLYF